MDKLTLSDIQSDLILVVGIITALGFLTSKLKEWLHNDIEEEIKPLAEKAEMVAKAAKALDEQQTKDFLVTEFARAERHELTDAERIHIKKRYDHYVKKPEEGGLGGNSYIKETYDKLQGEGRL